MTLDFDEGLNVIERMGKIAIFWVSILPYS